MVRGHVRDHPERGLDDFVLELTRAEGLEHFVVGGTRSDEEVRRHQLKCARQA